MRDAVVCAACGAKVREDRVRCLRCGEPLVDAASVQQPRPSRAPTFVAVAAGLGALALAGVVVTRPAPSVESGAADAKRKPRAVAQSVAPPEIAASIDGRRRGEAAYRAGDVTRALTSFEQAVQKDPNDPEARNNFGQLLVRTGRAAEAIPHFSHAISINPDRWAYHFNRARAFGELQQWSNAIAGYREAIRLFPDDYATQFNLAKALQKSGDLPGAIAGFERAIQLAPRQADFHLSYGLALEATQRPRDAAAAYRRYLELDAESPDADKVKARIAVLDGASTPTP